jgi:2-methylcitrate dehydratase PrpD
MSADRRSSDRVVAEEIGERLATISPEQIPADAVEVARRLFLDVAGLCVAARNEPYVTATIASTDGGGVCTALGQVSPPGAKGFDVFGAALINGTAAHGEDYDDTFEGGPVHAGAVVVPAVLAICERERLGGGRLLVGAVTGAELCAASVSLRPRRRTGPDFIRRRCSAPWPPPAPWERRCGCLPPP